MLFFLIIFALSVFSRELNETIHKDLNVTNGIKQQMFEFSCYAPPMVYGGWCSTNHGIFGKDKVKLTVEPVGDTTLFCEMNCCGKTQEFMDEIVCNWDCAGTPEIRCYGNPTGSAVQGFQYS